MLVFQIPSFEDSPPCVVFGVALSKQAECSVGARIQPTRFLRTRSSAVRAVAALAWSILIKFLDFRGGYACARRT